MATTKYNPEHYKKGDRFNSHVDSKQVITPVSETEHDKANDAREELWRETLRQIHSEQED